MYEHQENPLLRFLMTRFQAVGDAFRTNPRHKSTAKARLAWEVRGQAHTAKARLVDISRAGAALITKKVPPDGALVRLCVTGEEDTPWIEGRVLGADVDAQGKYRIRIQFHDPCPTLLLKSAVLSPIATLDSPVVPEVFEGLLD
jgi:hypothetical protein